MLKNDTCYLIIGKMQLSNTNIINNYLNIAQQNSKEVNKMKHEVCLLARCNYPMLILFNPVSKLFNI